MEGLGVVAAIQLSSTAIGSKRPELINKRQPERRIMGANATAQ
jgi:hypothetical protein